MTARVCSLKGCGRPLPAGSRTNRRYCSDPCKLKAHRRRHDPQVGNRTNGPDPWPLWMDVLADGVYRGNVQINGVWLRPWQPEYARWIAACFLLNPNITNTDRKAMQEIAELSKAEIKRLKRRVSRLETALRDYSDEHRSAAKKLSQRLETTLGSLDWDDLSEYEDDA